MMGNKTFRSEEEHLRSLLDETQGPYPLLSREDPVIFHNNSYERELFMEFNVDFGGESSCSAQDQQNDEDPFIKQEEPTWFMSASEAEDPTSSPMPSLETEGSKPTKMQSRPAPPPRYNPYASGPLIKSPTSKRGRPSKATSNSKMANYARNYREQKKNEMATMQMRNEELEAEIKLLRTENAKMKKALVKAGDEVNQLKKVIDQDSQIARVVANMGQSSSSTPTDFGLGARAGVCVHVGSLGTTVEVCKSCADNNQVRLDAKYQKFEASLDDVQLFNGDFSAFDSYLNGAC